MDTGLTITLITILIIISFFLSFISLVLLSYLFFQMRSLLRQQNEIILMDNRIRVRASKQIQKLATERLNDLVGKTMAKMEAELKKHFSDLADYTATQSNEMGKFIIKQQEAMNQESQLYVAKMHLGAEKEIEVYKQERLKKLDEQLRDIIFKAAREVIGRSISFSEHEDLVNKALENAKKEKLFV